MKAKDPPEAISAGVQARPFQNSYWIEPGRLLAGEYPGTPVRIETERRLKDLVAIGIDSFIDLTEDDELPGYAPLLAAIAPHASHRRFPILDHGLPHEEGFISRVLDAIDADLAEGKRVYLHCRAGVGRTGTVLGCYLIRQGMQSEAALDRLEVLWQQSARSRAIPQIPETADQTHFVLTWREQQAAVHSLQGVAGRIGGVLYGLAVAEATLRPGNTWGSDTAMTLLLAESLLASAGNSPDDQMRRYLQWQQDGHPGGSLHEVAVPAEVQRALASWRWTRKAYAGSHDPAKLDSHSLARTAAVAMYFLDEPGLVGEAAAGASRTTQQAPIVLDACRLYAALLVAALNGSRKEELVRFDGGAAARLLQQRALKAEVDALSRRDWAKAPQPVCRNDVLGTLTWALWGFAQSADFRSGLSLLASTNALPDGACAAYGALAGAFYSLSGVPADLRRKLGDPRPVAAVVELLASREMGRSS